MVNVESYNGYLYLRFTGLSEGLIHIHVYAATEDLQSLRIEPVTFLYTRKVLHDPGAVYMYTRQAIGLLPILLDYCFCCISLSMLFI